MTRKEIKIQVCQNGRNFCRLGPDIYRELQDLDQTNVNGYSIILEKNDCFGDCFGSRVNVEIGEEKQRFAQTDPKGKIPYNLTGENPAQTIREYIESQTSGSQ